MGAYLSAPSSEKKSDDFSDSEKLSYGVSRMQGWRISMEDAHNCVPDLAENTSLFGVFDGHGGSEVALYCALHFADVLKDLKNYKDEKYVDALKEAFMKIDKVLLEQQTIRELKILADRDPDSGPPTEEEMKAVEIRQQDEEECEEDEMELLHEEATMSIEDLLARYGKAANETKSQIKEEKAKIDGSESSVGSSSSKAEETQVKKEGPPSVDTEEGVSSSTDSTSEIALSGQGSSSKNDEPSSTSDVKVEDSVTSSDIKAEASSNEVTSTSESKEQDDSEPPLTTKTSVSGEEVVSSSSSSTDPSKSKSEDATSTKVDGDNDKFGGGEPASSVDTSSKSSGAKVKPSGKIQPRVKAVKLGPSDDDFDPGSGSESEEESENGFDSDEAVGGSSDSDGEEEEDEDDEEEEDMDMVKIPSLGTIAATSEEPGRDSGTTAVVALLKDYELYVANAGDSRCVLCRNGVAFDMSDDHKPEDDSEIKRIKAAGGHVNMQGRVNGGLNLSRAIGDHCYKTNTALELENQMISAMPDIRKVTLSSGDDFIVLACDGIWNVLSSQDVVNFVLARLPQPGSKDEVKLSSICEELMDTCLAPDTTGDGTGCDNMTCIIVRFNEEWLNHSSPNNVVEDTKSGEVNAIDSEKAGSNTDDVTDAKINGNISEKENKSSVKRARTETAVELESGSKRQKVEA